MIAEIESPLDGLSGSARKSKRSIARPSLEVADTNQKISYRGSKDFLEGGKKPLVVTPLLQRQKVDALPSGSAAFQTTRLAFRCRPGLHK